MIVFFFLTGASFFCASPPFLSFFEAFFWEAREGEDADDDAAKQVCLREPNDKEERCRGSIDSTSVA